MRDDQQRPSGPAPASRQAHAREVIPDQVPLPGRGHERAVPACFRLSGNEAAAARRDRLRPGVRRHEAIVRHAGDVIMNKG
jgi:hypothetical protein